jgi:hypothetical protein
MVIHLNELSGRLRGDLQNASQSLIDRLNVDWFRVKNYAADELKELEVRSL